MSKTAFLFTGQGAQYAGMGKDLYNNFKIYKDICDEASEYLKINLADISESDLTDTSNTQAAVFILAYGIYKLLNINPDLAAGFSLGEMTALAASGVLNFKDALDLIKMRGQVMSAACEHTPGLMYSIIGADDALVEQVCADISKSNNSYVIPVNYNCPGQLVISGEADAVNAAVKIFADKKIRAIKLNVAGAFHSKLMLYKQDEFAQFLKTIKFNPPSFIIYSNVTGDKFEKFDNILMQDYIIKQMSNPVRFRDTLENMERDGASIYLEIGAGKVLSGFVKRTCKDAKAILNIQDTQTLEQAFKIVSRETI